MPGPEMLQPSGDALAIETEALAALEVPAAALAGLPFGLARGERRPLRVPVTDPVVEQVPEGLRLSFALPRGAYATSVLRELLEETIWFGPGE
jgi:tRNA pseudouridine13 synthase